MGQVDLIVGDCRKVLSNMNEKSFHLVIADPPYRIRSWNGFGASGDKNYDGDPPPEYSEWLPDCFRVLKDNGSIFVFENPINIKALWDAMEAAGFIVSWTLVWWVTFRKSHPARGFYNAHFEPILCGVKTREWMFDRAPLKGRGSETGGDVFAAAAQVSNAIVPGQKPYDLIERLIKVHTKVGDSVLDPFAGSCVTLRAAKDLSRFCTGIEVNEALARQAIKYRHMED